MLILKGTGFVAIVLILCRSGAGILESLISPSKDSSSVETAGMLHLDQYILLLVSFHNKERLKMAMSTNLWEMETGNCHGNG